MWLLMRNVVRRGGGLLAFTATWRHANGRSHGNWLGISVADVISLGWSLVTLMSFFMQMKRRGVMLDLRVKWSCFWTPLIAVNYMTWATTGWTSRGVENLAQGGGSMNAWIEPLFRQIGQQCFLQISSTMWPIQCPTTAYLFLRVQSQLDGRKGRQGYLDSS